MREAIEAARGAKLCYLPGFNYSASQGFGWGDRLCRKGGVYLALRKRRIWWVALLIVVVIAIVAVVALFLDSGIKQGVDPANDPDEVGLALVAAAAAVCGLIGNRFCSRPNEK
jgi:hypothetical protein